MFVGYFPQEWLAFLIIGALCAVLFGVLFGIRHEIKSFKSLFVLIAVTFVLIFSSNAFDELYLHNFADNGETHAKPLYGCSKLEEYLETVPEYRNPIPANWKDIIDQPECRTGVITTIFISYLFAWSSVFFLSYFFCVAFRLAKNQLQVSVKQDVEESRDTKTKPPSTDQSLAPVKHNIKESKHTEIESLNADENQDIPSEEYTFASLGEDAETLAKWIFHNICIGDNHQEDGWDGHIFREFIMQDFKYDSEQKTKFKAGFKGEENSANIKVNFTWKSFLGMKNKARSKERIIEILEWKAECARTRLRILLGKFVAHCENEKNKYHNSDFFNPNIKNIPEFFKDVKSIAEKLKSELK